MAGRHEYYGTYEKYLKRPLDCTQAERRIDIITYKVEQFVRKIKAPIVCRMDNEELSFADGVELAEHAFGKYYIIDSVEIEGGKAVLTLTARTAPAISSVGDGTVPTEDWIRMQKEVYDTVPNLFDGV